MELITATHKDKVLTYIVAYADTERFIIDFATLEKELDVNPEQVKIILKGFHNQEILDVKWMNDAVRICLTEKAHDIIAHGGFTAQEEILKANFEKLDMQLLYLNKQLGPDYLETTSKISSIASAIASALTLMKLLRFNVVNLNISVKKC